MEVTRRNFLQTTAVLAGTAKLARPAANDRITVAMIGCGARAHELMAAILEHPQAEIVGLVDAYQGRIERALHRVKGRAKQYPDIQAVLADKSVDAVVVATPDHLHKQMIVDAVKAGKDVYSEKPMTYRSSEGNEIIAAARENNRVVQVGSQGVSSAEQRAAKEMIAAGKLGKITMIRAAYNRNTASGAWIYPIPPDASPKTVNWDMFLGSAPKRPFDLERFFRWRCYEDYSGGIATDLFVHLCTTIHFLMDAKAPARAVALGQLYRWKESRDVPDTINAVLEYPEGFAVNLSSTFNNEMAAEGNFQILGTEGALTLGGALTFFPENAREDNRWIVESWPLALEEAYWKDPKVIATELAPAKRPKNQPEKIRTANTDATVEHFRHFFESVKTRKPYWEDAGAGHQAAACAHLVNLAARERRMTEWDFSKNDIKA
ncbi:MAG TPA: Gfo/Idh/MocA family oxidoreductase [Bryobacteraceae bacterium]|nr:Gfo/Idh/MocA family oxidoreductase [Bryobacteraceae bacterium]